MADNNAKYSREAFVEPYQGQDGSGWLLWLFENDRVCCKIKVKNRDAVDTLKLYWIENRIWF